jgi:hypothetical protein
MPIWEPSKTQLKTMWEAGDPLDSAWAQFAVLSGPVAPMASSAHPTKGITFGVGRQDPVQTIKSNKKSDRAHLLDAIYAGRLSAIGFQRLRDGSDELVQIPKEYFSYGDARKRQHASDRPNIRWASGELTIAGTSYFDVRIFRAPLSADELLLSKTMGGRESVAAPVQRRIMKRSETTKGRPNTSHLIAKTAQKMWKTDLRFRTLTIKDMVRVVRAAILGKDCREQEIAGYKSSSMEKTISRALRDLRNPNKRNKRNKRNTKKAR